MVKTLNFEEGKLYIAETVKEYTSCIDKGPVVFLELNEKAPEDAAYVIGPDVLGDMEYLRMVFCHMSKIPYVIAETKRLIIRESNPQDASAFKEIYSGEEESFKEGSESLTEEGLEAYIKNMYGFYGFGLYTVVYKETGKVIGRVGFSFEDEAESPEIGFVIDKKYRRAGIAYEAAAAVIKYMRNNLQIDKLSGKCREDNTASLRLLRRLDEEFGIEIKTLKDEGKV